MKEYKSVNALMKHLRNSGIKIEGSKDKKKLVQIGYYHGYKGYRFNYSSNNRIPYKDFGELVRVIEFDDKIKSILYSPLMKIETTLKNVSLDVITRRSQSSSFVHIYNFAMTKTEIRAKLRIRNEVHRALSAAYNNNRIAKHFYDKGQEVPIWGIFEILTLGSFGEFIKCLDPEYKLDISNSLKLHKGYNTDGKLLPVIIFILQELRNTVAHNGVIFDTRFNRERSVSKTLANFLIYNTNIANINFNSIVDYLILVMFLLKSLGYSKTELKTINTQFAKAVDELYSRVDENIYLKVLKSDDKSKIEKLDTYIKK